MRQMVGQMGETEESQQQKGKETDKGGKRRGNATSSKNSSVYVVAYQTTDILVSNTLRAPR